MTPWDCYKCHARFSLAGARGGSSTSSPFSSVNVFGSTNHFTPNRSTLKQFLAELGILASNDFNSTVHCLRNMNVTPNTMYFAIRIRPSSVNCFLSKPNCFSKIGWILKPKSTTNRERVANCFWFNCPKSWRCWVLSCCSARFCIEWDFGFEPWFTSLSSIKKIHSCCLQISMLWKVNFLLPHIFSHWPFWRQQHDQTREPHKSNNCRTRGQDPHTSNVFNPGVVNTWGLISSANETAKDSTHPFQSTEQLTCLLSWLGLQSIKCGNNEEQRKHCLDLSPAL